MIGVSYSYFQVNRSGVGVQHYCALTTDVLQIHDFCCNDLVWGGDVTKAIAENKEASQEKPA
ncbi:MAG: hypothetical protein V7L20_16990 [Nostoc sp.]|uniref:hypothetical protein n=1 Tax=Nostoc sp. TaxID=1180 RepID=UPI002FF67DC0